MTELTTITINGTEVTYYITLEWSDYDFLNIPIVCIVEPKRLRFAEIQRFEHIIKLFDDRYRTLFIEQRGEETWKQMEKKLHDWTKETA